MLANLVQVKLCVRSLRRNNAYKFHKKSVKTEVAIKNVHSAAHPKAKTTTHISISCYSWPISSFIVFAIT